MVQNRIKVLRAEADMSATALANSLPDGVDKVAMSYIEHGKVLPTKDTLEKMCQVLRCEPLDVYSLEDIDLASIITKDSVSNCTRTPVEHEAAAVKFEIKMDDIKHDNTAGHGNDVQLRVWMASEEKEALIKSVRGLGYKSIAEWLREMYRQTIHKYIALVLEKTSNLHEALPPTTEIKRSDVV